MFYSLLWTMLSEIKSMYVASITCGLTAEDRDQLRNLTLISSMSVGFTCTILNLSTEYCYPL